MEKKIKEVRVLLMAIGGFYMLSSLVGLIVLRMITLLKGELIGTIPGIDQIANTIVDGSLYYFVPLFFLVGLGLFLVGYRFVAWRERAPKIVLALSALLLLFLVLIYKPLFSLLKGSLFDEMPNGELFEKINYGTAIFQIICIYASAIVPQWFAYRKVAQLAKLTPEEVEQTETEKDVLENG